MTFLGLSISTIWHMLNLTSIIGKGVIAILEEKKEVNGMYKNIQQRKVNTVFQH